MENCERPLWQPFSLFCGGKLRRLTLTVISPDPAVFGLFAASVPITGIRNYPRFRWSFMQLVGSFLSSDATSTAPPAAGSIPPGSRFFCADPANTKTGPSRLPRRPANIDSMSRMA
jgi:hypothetical protein